MSLYVVTGGAGFIGSHLADALLAEGHQIRVVDDLSTGHHRNLDPRVELLVGDVADAVLMREALVGAAGVFHLAAIYDMTADDATNEAMNVDGTRHALALAEAVGAGCFHHVSSVAAAGDFRGVFDESMFAEGQHLPSAYHRTKYESERIVREEATVPWRVYRPSIVVGHSETGAMDKIDGPYYFFPLLKVLRDAGLVEVDAGHGQRHARALDLAVDAALDERGRDRQRVALDQLLDERLAGVAVGAIEGGLLELGADLGLQRVE